MREAARQVLPCALCGDQTVSKQRRHVFRDAERKEYVHVISYAYVRTNDCLNRKVTTCNACGLKVNYSTGVYRRPTRREKRRGNISKDIRLQMHTQRRIAKSRTAGDAPHDTMVYSYADALDRAQTAEHSRRAETFTAFERY
jgi:hypothetical protein